MGMGRGRPIVYNDKSFAKTAAAAFTVLIYGNHLLQGQRLTPAASMGLKDWSLNQSKDKGSASMALAKSLSTTPLLHAAPVPSRGLHPRARGTVPAWRRTNWISIVLWWRSMNTLRHGNVPKAGNGVWLTGYLRACQLVAGTMSERPMHI